MLEKRLNVISPEDLIIAPQQKTCGLCPCPQLTAYWTPPPSCFRRVCCCEAASKVQPFGAGVFRDSKTGCIFFGIILLAYYFVMDVIMFKRFLSVDIVEEAKPGSPDEIFSPFTHLTIKAVMCDPTSQYIVGPSAEYFNAITKFATVFSFITPNMVSFTHLIVGFLAGKFVASENLYDRRVGVALFELRIWLDAFDGVVFRAQNGKHLHYESIRTSLGYFVDMICDAMGGTFLSFGLLFYLLKRFDHCKQELPTFMVQDGAAKSLLPSNGHDSNGRETYSKKYLFWKVFCFGLSLALAGKFWDMVVADFEGLFQVPVSDPKLKELQFEMCHSWITILIMCLWRILEAQALLQYILIPIFIDRIWEFLNYTQYILLLMIVGLYLITLLYIHHVRTVLHM